MDLSAADHGSEPPSPPAAQPLPGDDGEAATSTEVTWPRISDYWPDAPQQAGPTADYYEIPSTEPARTGQALFTRTQVPSRPPQARAATRPQPSGPPAQNRRRGRPWTILGALIALSTAIGTGLLLTRTTHQTDPQPDAAAPTRSTSTAARPFLAPGPSASTTPATAGLELVSDTTEWTVRTAALGDRDFRVSTPPEAGITARASFTRGVLRVSVTPVRTGGSGRVDVLLSERITWRLLMTGGVKRASFDMGRNTVSLIDLAGGARDIDIVLARQAGTIPIRMSGGVHSWRIRTEGLVPARILVQRGAGSVVVNGKRRDSIARDTTIRSGNLDRGAGIDVDAVAGIGSLQVVGG